MFQRSRVVMGFVALTAPFVFGGAGGGADIGRELAVPHHMYDGQEYRSSLNSLLRHGQSLFSAVWTDQEGGGRPMTKGVGTPLADPSQPLVFPRNTNRISAPDANSCAGCHNAPFGVAGGGGDLVTNVFVLGQRFDFASFDASDPVPTKGAVDEAGRAAQLQTIANSRSTLGMFGAGYIEMLARQITRDLQRIRDGLAPGQSGALTSKGIQYGVLARRVDGSWDTAGVQGLPAPSLTTSGPANPPSLVIRPFHQAGNVVSVRQFSVNAFNHHHGIQATERFGTDTDPDGDGFRNEMTVADVTAVALYQATLPVPGRVIPRNGHVERAIRLGEQRFREIGCASCHIPKLPLDDDGRMYSEPNPYNPAGTLSSGRPVLVDLNDRHLPPPRLAADANGVVWVPAFTDMKLHDITDGPNDPNREPLDMNQPAGSPGFFAGNGQFLTKKLWGAANEPPYFHHGQFTTLRQAVEAHRGEATAAYQGWRALNDYDRDAVIEFLKSLQVLPPGTVDRVVDERGRARDWPDA